MMGSPESPAGKWPRSTPRRRAYALVALAFGVFYREYTRFSGFSGDTRLSFLHGHHFALGLVFFLLLVALEKLFAFSAQRGVRGLVILYNVWLNITGLGFLLRGLADVAGGKLSRSVDASISGVAGLGHILLAVSMILLLFRVRKTL